MGLFYTTKDGLLVAKNLETVHESIIVGIYREKFEKGCGRQSDI